MKDFLIKVVKGFGEFILSIILGLLVILVFWVLGLWELIRLSGKFLLRKPLATEDFSLKTVLYAFIAPFILIYYYVCCTKGLKRELGKVNS